MCRRLLPVRSVSTFLWDMRQLSLMTLIKPRLHYELHNVATLQSWKS